MFKRLALVVLSVVVMGFGLVAFSPPASAVSTLTACFRWDSGAAYSGQPVYLLKWDAPSQRWVMQTKVTTNSYGCGQWVRVPQNGYYAAQAETRLGTSSTTGYSWWRGATPNYAGPGSYAATLHGTVSMYSCIRSTYNGSCPGKV